MQIAVNCSGKSPFQMQTCLPGRPNLFYLLHKLDQLLLFQEMKYFFIHSVLQTCQQQPHVSRQTS